MVIFLEFTVYKKKKLIIDHHEGPSTPNQLSTMNQSTIKEP